MNDPRYTARDTVTAGSVRGFEPHLTARHGVSLDVSDVTQDAGASNDAWSLATLQVHIKQGEGPIMTDATDDDAPVLELLARMTEDSLEASSLDVQTLVLVRVAALVAVGAPPVSYALNLEAAGEVGLDAERLRGVLTAIAPIVGTARVAAATGNIVKALAAEIALEELEVAELEDEAQGDQS